MIIKNANKILQNISSIQEKIHAAKSNVSKLPDNIQTTMNSNGALLDMFFSTRKEFIRMAASNAF